MSATQTPQTWGDLKIGDIVEQEEVFIGKPGVHTSRWKVVARFVDQNGHDRLRLVDNARARQSRPLATSAIIGRVV